MGARYVAAIDQGTTASRCILFDSEGRPVREFKRPHQSICPHPGWVENDPFEILENVRRCVDDVLQSLEPGDEVAALGITNQRETAIVWNRHTGQPVYNAINWQDSRTIEHCRRIIEQGRHTLIKEKTGLPVFPYFSASKVQWILENVSGARVQAESGDLLFGTIDSWLVWNLTGGPGKGTHATDPSNASRTMLFNINTLDWDDELLGLFTVPRSLMPAVLPSSSQRPYGIAPFLNGRVLLPITGVIGDQQSALVGQSCFNPGEVKNSYGTACAILMNIGTSPVYSRNGLVTTIAYTLSDGTAVYAFEGPTGTTGAAVGWLQSSLGLIHSLDEVEGLAASVEDNGGVYFVPAFSGLYAPYWDLDVKGTIVGLTAFSTKAHLVRATLEAICYQTRDVIDTMAAESGHAVRELKADGGATQNRLLMQLQSDILGVRVRPAANLESTCLGAAYLAGVATGFWPSLHALAQNWQAAGDYRPEWPRERSRDSYAGWQDAVAKARHRS